MCFKACLLFSTLILLHSVLGAQMPFNQQLRMRSLSVNEGLPQGYVSGIAQDSQGFIWIASDGLSRYDGRNFVHFRHIGGDTLSLASNSIVYMRLDDSSNLWLVYNSREVDIFNTLTGRVRHISAEKAYRWMKGGIGDSYFITQEGRSYFRADLTSLTAFDPWGTYKEQISLPHGESLLAIGATRMGMRVVSTHKALYEIRENRLFKIADFPPVSKEAERWLQKAITAHSRTPGRIMESPSGILIVPGMGFIYLYDQKNRLMKYIPTGMLDLPWGIVHTGEYSYARFYDGLVCFNEQGVVTQLTRVADLILTDPLLMDRSGVLWAATAGAVGMRLLDLQPVNFDSYHYKNGFLHDALEPWLSNPMQDEVALGSYQGRCAKDMYENVWVVSYINALSNESGRKLNWHSRGWPGSGVYRLGNGQAWKLPFHLPGWKISNIAFDSRNQ